MHSDSDIMRFKALPNGFDEHGNLPHGIYEILDQEFKEFFVENFGDSSTRGPIYEKYCSYMSMIKPLAPCYCRWLDGSYVTNKLNPGDIDILLHIDFEAEPQLDERLFDHAFAKENFSCHAFVHPIYPESDVRHRQTLENRAYWLKWFTLDRSNRSKGMVEMKD